MKFHTCKVGFVGNERKKREENKMNKKSEQVLELPAMNINDPFGLAKPRDEYRAFLTEKMGADAADVLLGSDTPDRSILDIVNKLKSNDQSKVLDLPKLDIHAFSARRR